ncbi:hypothetical protein ASPZODRAFT_140126 [Penicilliopsis zonata CBS 506.65]|uniref:Uncharacterized protein n=1 Tax=Penicilliopsis zonata CBS 506.65 TaxID=1073090 RepID=A0A1L9SPM4_9EURO|nr:hypothetical protein ASPZODRAFT_140126 [Penicilliopsis zonata CBS 506.65]OJJ49195.1 hypothetical protein ASPZODRAFT_140126 [Penicilliopsis zonata CBS 506.65]
MTSFTERGFFGDAIFGAIPQGWIDASDLREIPDHQEVFLSPSTLSSLIIEINQRVSDEDARSMAQRISSASSAAEEDPEAVVDKAAALYHLNDICEEGDLMHILTPPQRVRLPKFPSSSGTAYRGVVCFETTNRRQRGNVHNTSSSTNNTTPHPLPSPPFTTNGAVAGSSTARSSRAGCHFLLVRLAEQETDLLVVVNVPHDEFDSRGDERGLNAEEALGAAMVAKIVETLDVRNWGLFV